MHIEKGYLLSYLKYSDKDAILHLFSFSEGYQSYYLRGAYAPKSKKKAYLTPLNELQLTVFPSKSNSALKQLSNIEGLKSSDWSENIKASSVVFFVSDFLNQILREESQNLSLYREIEKFNSELSHGNFQSHLIFLARILEIQGFYPLVNDFPYLDPESGAFVQRQTHHLFHKELSDLYRQIFLSESPYEVKIPTSTRKEFLETLMVYYQYHHANFKVPRSLEIVKELF
ncbi:DNA repair protein RecO [Chryseobacterium sp. A301]